MPRPRLQTTVDATLGAGAHGPHVTRTMGHVVASGLASREIKLRLRTPGFFRAARSFFRARLSTAATARLNFLRGGEPDRSDWRRRCCPCSIRLSPLHFFERNRVSQLTTIRNLWRVLAIRRYSAIGKGSLRANPSRLTRSKHECFWRSVAPCGRNHSPFIPLVIRIQRDRP